MGARVARMVRNVNLENRVAREISREKPHAAPRHPTRVTETPPSGPEAPGVPESIHKKNDPLLSLLKTVYVQSQDPDPPEAPKPAVAAPDGEERRPLKFSLPGDAYGLADITDVPKGKLSLVEALRALNLHKTRPQTWTPERVAQEYALSPGDTAALLAHFIPFDIKVIPPKSAGAAKRIKGS